MENAIAARVQTLVLTQRDVFVLSLLLSFIRMPATYVYTLFISNFVLAKSIAIGKTSRQTFLLDC